MKIGIISELTHNDNYSDNIFYRLFRKLNIPLRKIYFDEFKLYCVKKNNKKSIISDYGNATSENLELLYIIDVIGAEIPYSVEELKEFSGRYLRKYMTGCLKGLKEMGIERTLFTDGIKEIYETERLSQGMLHFEFSKAVTCSVLDIIKKIPHKVGINPAEEMLGIICSRYNEKSKQIIKRLITEVKFIRIYTNDTADFSETSEEFYNSFGIFTEVCDYKPIWNVNDKIAFDLESGILRIGRDIVIDDIKYCINTCKYSVKDIELIDIINEKAEKFRIKYCKGGKNRLTI